MRFIDGERRRLAVKGKVLGLMVLRGVASIVTPDTILVWPRRLIAQFAWAIAGNRIAAAAPAAFAPSIARRTHRRVLRDHARPH